MGASYVVRMRIPRAQLDELIAHAREEAPYECCGYARMDDGRIEEVFRGESARRSKWGFEFDFKTLMAANELDDAGHGVAVYHSHPRSPAEPSQTDINLAHYPHWTYLIVSLAGDDPVVRAWRMQDGRVEEEPIDVE